MHFSGNCVRARPQVEEDGNPDLDLPALDMDEPIKKFHFDGYCLCKVSHYDEVSFANQFA